MTAAPGRIVSNVRVFRAPSAGAAGPRAAVPARPVREFRLDLARRVRYTGTPDEEFRPEKGS